ncbi:MAG: GvpL/GvpF family gas vesicle protein [Terriglobales bacterium]
MLLLAYCITETSAAVRPSRPGVNGLPVKSLEHSGLRCFVSESIESAPLQKATGRDSALVFHSVLEEIFKQAAIIPFRFPTILAGEADVIAHLEEHLTEYRTALKRLRDMVQMEVRVQLKHSSPERTLAGSSNPEGSQIKQSGAEYLKRLQARHAKLETAANAFRQACERFAKAWKQRDSVDGIHCFALIERASVPAFRIESQSVAVQPEIVARLSGPWPAAEFLKEK